MLILYSRYMLGLPEKIKKVVKSIQSTSTNSSKHHTTPNWPSKIGTKRRTMNKPQVLFIADLDESLPEFLEFQSKFEIIRYHLTTKEELISKLSAEFHNVQAIYSGWLGFMPIGGLTSDIVDRLPDTVKVVTTCAVGYDPYDIQSLKARGIQFYNTPSLGAESVADTILWHVLEAFRHFTRFQNYAREYGHTVKARGVLHSNAWDNTTGQVQGGELTYHGEYPFGEISGRGKFVETPSGRKAGIVGFGKIGKATGKRLSVLGMEIKYYQRHEIFREDELKLGYEVEYYDDLKKLVSEVDVVILTLPGNQETKGLLGKEVLDSFKHGGKLINVGRGMIIDSEDYVVDLLEQGKLSFFGADVFDGEPVINERLLHRQDVSLSPHVGSSTRENFDATAAFALRNITCVLEGREGESRVV